MIAPFLALCLLTLPQDNQALSADGANLVVDEGHAFLELSSPGQEYVVGQSIPIMVRFGLERSFAESSQIQLFRTQLEVPVQILGDWIGGGEVLIRSEAGRDAASGWPRFALLDNLLSVEPLGELERAGQTYLVYGFTRRFRVEEPQELKLAPLEMRYAFATEFEESFLNGRSPSNRVDALVRSNGLTLEIKSLPLDNPPIDFTGAIGSFRVSGALRDLGDDGRGIGWTLRVEGQGNHHEIEAPSVAQFSDFNLLGSLSPPSSSAEAVREFHYDLVPKGERPGLLPSFSFQYFDVELGDFRSVSTAPLELPSVAAKPVAPQVTSPSGVDEAGKATSVDDNSMIWAGGLGALALALAAYSLRSRGSGAGASEPAPQNRALEREAAAQAFLTAMAAGRAGLLEDYSAYLGSCLSLAAGELQAEGLAERLGNEGIPLDLAKRAQEALSALLAANYGRGESSAAGQSAPSIVKDLAQQWA